MIKNRKYFQKTRFPEYRVMLIFLSVIMSHFDISASENKISPEPMGINISAKIGYNPQMFRDFFQGNSTNTLLIDRIQNRVDQINRDYTNLSNYNRRKVISNFQYDNDIQFGVPFGIDLNYRFGFFSVELGFAYQVASQTNMSYDLTVGDKTVRFNNTSIAAYQDIDENADLDSIFVPSAYGLFPTDGNTVRFLFHSRAESMQIPMTFFIHIDADERTSLALGMGISYFSGFQERNIYASELGKSDIDRFEASAIGFHFSFRGIYRLFTQLNILIEGRFNFSVSDVVLDKVITGKGTLDSLFHFNEGSDWGGGELPGETGSSSVLNPVPGRGTIRSEALDFTGIQFFVGTGYSI